MGGHSSHGHGPVVSATGAEIAATGKLARHRSRDSGGLPSRHRSVSSSIQKDGSIIAMDSPPALMFPGGTYTSNPSEYFDPQQTDARQSQHEQHQSVEQHPSSSPHIQAGQAPSVSSRRQSAQSYADRGQAQELSPPLHSAYSGVQTAQTADSVSRYHSTTALPPGHSIYVPQDVGHSPRPASPSAAWPNSVQEANAAPAAYLNSTTDAATPGYSQLHHQASASLYSAVANALGPNDTTPGPELIGSQPSYSAGGGLPFVDAPTSSTTSTTAPLFVASRQERGVQRPVYPPRAGAVISNVRRRTHSRPSSHEMVNNTNVTRPSSQSSMREGSPQQTPTPRQRKDSTTSIASNASGFSIARKPVPRILSTDVDGTSEEHQPSSQRQSPSGASEATEEEVTIDPTRAMRPISLDLGPGLESALRIAQHQSWIPLSSPGESTTGPSPTIWPSLVASHFGTDEAATLPTVTKVRTGPLPMTPDPVSTVTPTEDAYGGMI